MKKKNKLTNFIICILQELKFQKIINLWRKLQTGHFDNFDSPSVKKKLY